MEDTEAGGDPAWLTGNPPGEPQVMMHSDRDGKPRTCKGKDNESADKWRLVALSCRNCHAKWCASGTATSAPCPFCGSPDVLASPST